MFGLRVLFYLSPLALVFAAVTLFLQVGRLQLPDIGDAMTGSIRESIGPLNPIVPVTGVTREVRDLIFDPLLIRDDDLRLRSHLIDTWQKQTVITIRCSSEEAAGETEARFRSGEWLAEGQKLIGVDRLDSVVSVALDGFEKGGVKKLMRQVRPEYQGDYLLVRLTLNHSIRESFATFLGGSVEKTQIKMLDYEGDRIAYLFLKGETDLFLRELQLYYESNMVLDPQIDVMGQQCHTSSQELILHLEETAKWHDGEPVTADDLVFSYNVMTRPGSPLPLASSFQFVESIFVVDERNLRIACQSTPATMMESWEKLPLLPSHRFSDGYTDETLKAFFDNPVGTGPYRLQRRLPDGGVVLEAFPDYIGGLPKQQRIVYRKFESLESKLLALRSGVIDTLEPDSRFQDWALRNPGTVRQIRCLPRIQHLVAWNLQAAPLNDVEVRLALAEAVDLKAVLRDSATSFQQPVDSLFFPGSPFVSGSMPLPLYDPRSAERRLDEAGFRFNEEKGTRVDEQGATLAFDLVVNEANGEQVRLAEALAEQWSGVGVVVVVKELSWQEILTDRLATRNFDGILLSWEVPKERDRYSTLHSDAIKEGGGNLFGLRNQIVDELLTKLREETDEASVAAAADQLQEEVAELQPCFFVCESGRILWIRSRSVEVARPKGDGTYSVAEPGIGKAGLESVRPWWVRRAPEWTEEERQLLGE